MGTPRLSLSHMQSLELRGPPPLGPAQEDVEQDPGGGSENCQACCAHTRAKNTEDSSVKVSEAGIVPTRVIMTHGGHEDPCSHLTPWVSG